MTAIAFHKPEGLRDERDSAIAAAAYSTDSIEAARIRGHRLATAIITGNVLGDGRDDVIVS